MSVVNLVGRILGRVGEKFIQGVEGIDKLKLQFEQKIILTESDNMWQSSRSPGDHVLLTQDPQMQGSQMQDPQMQDPQMQDHQMQQPQKITRRRSVGGGN
jgi:hypothetical protein